METQTPTKLDPVRLETIPYPFAISFSQFSLFLECPKRYQLQYRSAERLKSLPYPNTLLGDAMHNTLEFFYLQMQQGEPITELKQLEEHLGVQLWSKIQAAGENINLQKCKEMFPSESSWQDYYQHEMRELFTTGKTLLGAFFKEHYKDDGRFIPEAVETVFNCELPDADKYPGLRGVKFTARIDYLEYDTLTDEYRLIDHKLSARFDKSKLERNPQLTLYAYLINRLLHKPVSAVGYQILDTSTKKVSKIFGTRTEDDFDSLLKDLADIVPSMKLPFYYKRPGDHCSYCPAKAKCISNQL